MNRTLQVVAALGIGALIAGGTATFASWSASGTGDATAGAAIARPLVVTAGTTTADLYPGFGLGDVFLTVDNPNPYPVVITAITPGAITSSAPACTASNVSVATATGLSIPVAAGALAAAVTVPNVVTMIAGAPDACQGVTFDVSVTLAGAQV